MFNSKTLFIVGAGASQEAGLPTSAKLRDDIAGQLNIAFELNRLVSGDGQIADALIKHAKQNGENVGAYFHAASQLHAALPHAISIDNLIDAHGHDPTIEFCGKLGIARSILKAEAASRLKARNSRRDLSPEPDLALLEGTWYPEFSKLLSENVRKDKITTIFENVSFIVFNYDRCVEYYLYHFLQEVLPKFQTKKCDLSWVRSKSCTHMASLASSRGRQQQAALSPLGAMTAAPVF